MITPRTTPRITPMTTPMTTTKDTNTTQTTQKMTLTRVLGPPGTNGNNTMTGTTSTQTEPDNGTRMTMDGSYLKKKKNIKHLKMHLHKIHGPTCLHHNPTCHQLSGMKARRPCTSKHHTVAEMDWKSQQCHAT